MAIASSTITTGLLDTTVSANNNLLQPNAFKVQINRTKFPNIEFFAVGVIHPGMGMTATEIPFRRVQSVPFSGSAINFGEVTIDTIVDEDMKAYTEIFNWMHYMVQNDDVLPSQASELKAATYSDINVQILNSSNNVIRTIKYKEAIPTLLGDVSLLSTTGDIAYINCPISFRFNTFEII